MTELYGWSPKIWIAAKGFSIAMGEEDFPPTTIGAHSLRAFIRSENMDAYRLSDFPLDYYGEYLDWVVDLFANVISENSIYGLRNKAHNS